MPEGTKHGQQYYTGMSEEDPAPKEHQDHTQTLLLDIFSITASISHMAFALLWHGHERKALFTPLP